MLFESHSYRDFLQEELLRRIRSNPRYSQRAFARNLRIGAGELSEILRGKRPLSLKAASKIATALGLNEVEREHFLRLVNQEKTSQLVSTPRSQKRETTRNLTLDLFAAVSDWYCFAILNLADCEGFRWQSKWISRRLGVSPIEVEQALARLVRLGLLEKKGGGYVKHQDHVIADEGIPSEAIRNYHRQILEKAMEALDTKPASEREITGVTFSANPEHFKSMRKEISQFLDQMAVKYSRARNRKEVFQVEVALFKLTQEILGDKS